MQFKPIINFPQNLNQIDILFLPGNTGNGIFASSVGVQSSFIKFEINKFTTHVGFDIPLTVDPRLSSSSGLSNSIPTDNEISQPTLNASVPYYVQFYRNPTK